MKYFLLKTSDSFYLSLNLLTPPHALQAEHILNISWVAKNLRLELPLPRHMRRIVVAQHSPLPRFQSPPYLAVACVPALPLCGGGGGQLSDTTPVTH